MHPKMADIEDRLRKVLNELDTYLEDTYGDTYSLHPNRLPRGEAASPSYDGLFTVHGKFSLGYGTKSGRGYVLSVNLSTLEQVPGSERAAIEQAAAEKLDSLLPEYFPERRIHVSRDGRLYKITGDFSLGSA